MSSEGIDTLTKPVEELLGAFVSRTARIGVIGLGYVGFPLCRSFSEAGFPTLGIDIDDEKVQFLNSMRSYINYISDRDVRKMVTDYGFSATSDYSQLADIDVVLACVPTPLTDYKEPDLSFVRATMEEVAKNLRPRQLIILESTTYPGTTMEVVKPILEKNGARSGVDFFLGYSPEREDPGNRQFMPRDIPKIIAGDGEHALRLVKTLYDQVNNETVPVSTPAVAEAAKLTENIFRSVNIALVNELKVIFDRMGIDVWEVLESAGTKPFGFMKFQPGPGLGGHCIPIDPYYLSWRARAYDVHARFIELAGEINTMMPHFVIEKLVKALNDRLQKSMNGSRILVVGVSYKKNVDDTRESPAFELIEQIEERGGKADFFDPYVSTIPATRKHLPLKGRTSIYWDKLTISGYDAAIICTDHDDIDYTSLVEWSKLVVDTRNVTRDFDKGRFNIVPA